MCEEKKEYGKTLNLPKTDFPMRANLPENEPKILENVFEKGLYEKMLKKNEGKTPFVLHDGPPYANGGIHIGHALNKILKDTVVRYKNLKGFYTPFVPGFDTHGMPTEKKAIEKSIVFCFIIGVFNLKMLLKICQRHVNGIVAVGQTY